MSKNTISQTHEERLRALCMLSNVAEPMNFNHLVSFVQDAPDPETAVRGVLDQMPHAASDVLTRKWRTVITDLWATHHPNIPLLPELSLASSQVADAPTLSDALALLTALEQGPARLVQEQEEWLVDPDDVVRLAKELPSRQGLAQLPIENEWAYPAFRRLRAVLHAARLVRPHKGELVPVRSRVTRFRSLPTTQQFFILWHADVYHVDWGRFAGLWSSYMHVVQEYLPLLWDASDEPTTGQVADRGRWAMNLIDAFGPLWEDEGLIGVRRGHTAALHIVQQHALPTIIDRFLLRDLFERHGLVTIKEEFGSLSKFTWTGLGEAMIPAEAEQKLPCGIDLLSN